MHRKRTAAAILADEKKESTKRRKSTAIRDAGTGKQFKLDDDSPFERGGGSSLTPLEMKEIGNKAAQDVLFDTEMEKKPINPKKGKSRNGSKLRVESAPTALPVKIEGLNHKNLSKGSTVLATVLRIGNLGLTLSLPNNLTGFVTLANISQYYAAALDKLLVDDDTPGRLEREEELEGPSNILSLELSRYFREGQYLRATVTVSSEESGLTSSQTKDRKRIELSVDPRIVNQGLSRKSFVTGCSLQAVVTSLEDHGLIMDIGCENGYTGFMPFAELGGIKPEPCVGQVMLCTVTELLDAAKVVRLADAGKDIENEEKPRPGRFLKDAPSVDILLPGTAAEILITEIGKGGGFAGKFMGSVDVVADVFHAAQWLSSKPEIKPGTMVQARIIYNIATNYGKKLGVSLMPHILVLSAPYPFSDSEIGKYMDDAEIVCAQPAIGLIAKIEASAPFGFIHISKISSEERVDATSSSWRKFAIGSKHRARVVGFSAMDNLFIMSTEETVLRRKYLTIADILPGAVMTGHIERTLPGKGVVVRINEEIHGFVEEFHIADVQVQNPEKKFKEGLPVRCRALASDSKLKKLYLTMKKSIVNSDAEVLSDYDAAYVGLQTVGTLVSLSDKGAVVRFFGEVKAFLPVAEMSDAFIGDPREHFRVGQTVNVHITALDKSKKRMTVSCRDPKIFSSERLQAFSNLRVGAVTSGRIAGKSGDTVMLDINVSDTITLKGQLPSAHLTDARVGKAQNVLKRLRIGQVLRELVCLSKNPNSQIIETSMKPSVLEAAQAGKFPATYEEMEVGACYTGLVKTVSAAGALVRFAGSVRGFLPARFIPAERLNMSNFGLEENDSIEVRLVTIDSTQNRCTLSMLSPEDLPVAITGSISQGDAVMAQILSVKSTQINVQIDGGRQGRIDATEIFDSWYDIKSKKEPLKAFQPKQIVKAIIVGTHDARTHSFLPITHRNRNNQKTLYEISIKPSRLASKSTGTLKLEELTQGMEVLGFINNHANDGVWVSVSPTCRGFVRTLELSDNIAALNDVSRNFPVGSVLRCRVLKIDAANERLDLSGRMTGDLELSWDNIKCGMVLNGRVTKINGDSLTINLSPEISGVLALTNISDNFEEVSISNYRQNQILKVAIVGLNLLQKRVLLSTRRSHILGRENPVVDEELHDISQVEEQDIRRGFVRSATDKGLFVALGENVTAFVRIRNVSDEFVRDWKDLFRVGQLVKGRILSCDKSTGKIEMSLRKTAIVDEAELFQFSNLAIGQVVSGRVSGISDFGVFINVDNSLNVSGLCHRSELTDGADKEPSDFNVGDIVLARVLKIDPIKRKIAFGLKESYFVGTGNEEDGGDSQSASESIDFAITNSEDANSQPQSEPSSALRNLDSKHSSSASVLFDWTLNALDEHPSEDGLAPDSEHITSRKDRRKPADKNYRTNQMNARGPTSTSEFERSILENPQESIRWIEYMGFLLGLNEVDKARQVAERAIKQILYGSPEAQKEKQNVWVALLNLELEYGNNESVDATFRRSCQYNDDFDMFRKYAEMLIASGRIEKAEEILKQFMKKYSTSAEPYILYAELLYSPPPPHPQQVKRGREILPRALVAIPKTSESSHIVLVSKFAHLEFKFGDPERGRTIFENLLDKYSKRSDIFSQWVDLEIIRSNENEQHRSAVRKMFARALDSRSCNFGLRGVKSLLKKWERWETETGGNPGAAHSAAAAFAQSRT